MNGYSDRMHILPDEIGSFATGLQHLSVAQIDLRYRLTTAHIGQLTCRDKRTMIMVRTCDKIG